MTMATSDDEAAALRAAGLNPKTTEPPKGMTDMIIAPDDLPTLSRAVRDELTELWEAADDPALPGDRAEDAALALALHRDYEELFGVTYFKKETIAELQEWAEADE